MPNEISTSRRHLPHWQLDGAVYWVTFRLADSVPQALLREWQAKRAEWLDAYPQPWDAEVLDEYNKLFGDKFEKWLDDGMGSRALARADVKNIVRECLLFSDGTRHTLHAAVIMPTHVHCLLEPHDGWKLPQLLKSIKGISANKINKLLGKNGTFWQDESFDHIVRSELQYDHYLMYIKENPARAGLKADEWWMK